MLSELINQSKKIVIKIGSNTLANKNGMMDEKVLNNLSYQINDLIKNGKQIVLVSSGAGVAGVATIDKWFRREDTHYFQALCAIGQVELMDAYRKVFNEYDINIGQMLLTREDFYDKTRTLNIRNTLFTLVDEGVIPIVNENDTVSVDEIKIGDNDTLAAFVSNLWNADLLVLLSDIDGVFNKNPKDYSDAKLVEVVDDVENLYSNIEIGRNSDFGTGGIATKIEAAKTVNEYDIPMILTNGKKEDILLKLQNGTEKATVFIPKNKMR